MSMSRGEKLGYSRCPLNKKPRSAGLRSYGQEEVNLTPFLLTPFLLDTVFVSVFVFRLHRF